MLNLMIDKETLALHKNAVIAQIGLVAFDGNFTPVNELCLNIDITSSLLDGFEVDPGTARGFWAKQPQAVQQSVLFDGPRLPPRDAARIIDKWLKDTFKGEFTIWANGILFDVPKMDNLFERYGMKPLTERTRYNLVYDFRTIRAAVKQIHPDLYAHAESIMPNTMAHNALADSHYQVAMLNACMAILAGKYEIVKDEEPTSLYDELQAMDQELADEDQPEPEPELLQQYETMSESVANPSQDDVPEKSWEDDEVVNADDGFIDHVLGSPDKDNKPVQLQG